MDELRVTCYACTVMPDHSHLVLRAHRYAAEELIGILKRAASRQFGIDDCHPLKRYTDSRGRTPTPWVEGGWKRFLNTPPDVVGAVDYVEGNPEKIGLSRQSHAFVVPFPWLRPSAPRGRGG
jgi:hypothetical protein